MTGNRPIDSPHRHALALLPLPLGKVGLEARATFPRQPFNDTTSLPRAVVACIVAMSILLHACAYAQEPHLVAPTPPNSPEEQRKLFHLPEGFEIELVAAEPQIAKPMNIAFDEKGRLWITDSVEYPFAAPPGTTPRDTVKIIEDFGADGRARKVSTFAGGLNIPIGVLPWADAAGDGCFVFSIPSIWRMRDTDGDGRADDRTAVFTGFGQQDTHGLVNALTVGFDGWIYACHGFANTSEVRRPGGPVLLRMNSGNTFRFRPDGSAIEQFTHGQVNPFGLALDSFGNLYSADCHSRPVTLLLRGGYYQSFGKPDDGLGFVPDICGHDHGSTGIAGIAYYAADQFPSAYHGTIFVGNVVTNRINHDRVEWLGSSPRCVSQPDFVRCDDPWFRPVDLKLGPDGALYVADFYNKIIGHYEVPLTHPDRDRERGRIWRIVYRGADRSKKLEAQPSTRTGAMAGLLQDLEHPNLTVRMLAANQLVRRRAPSLADALRKLLRAGSTPHQSVQALWILEQLQSLDAETLKTALNSSDRLVRVHAWRLHAERSKPLMLSDAEFESLAKLEPLEQRMAMEALGRHPVQAQIRRLAELSDRFPENDVMLRHAGRMALRDHLAAVSDWAALDAASARPQDMARIRDVLPGVASAESAGFLLRHIAWQSEPLGNLTRYVGHIARYGAPGQSKELMAQIQEDRPDDLPRQLALLRAIDQGLRSRGGERSREFTDWTAQLIERLFSSNDRGLVLAAIELCGSHNVPQFRSQLRAIAGESTAAMDHRSAALTALVALAAGGQESQSNRPVIAEQVAQLGRILREPVEPGPLREHAANLLAGLAVPEARVELVEALKIAPARLQTPIASALANSRPGAETLLDACAAGKASPHLLNDRVIQLKLARHGIPGAATRIADLLRDLPSLDQKMASIMDARRTGFTAGRDAGRLDMQVGAKVFEKNCAICHQINGRGAKIAPQLDGVGTRGLDRILEDVLDPNRNVDQAFRSSIIALKNGQVISGLVISDEGEVTVVADAQGKEVRVDKKAVDERTISKLSSMPANVIEIMTESEFYHLVAFLLAQRAAP